MAGQRKLMSEIDRTLKKVTEGVEVFNDIWDKVYSASAQNQKEKHEADLKKEIKKLQRFRDQIKNWISNSDVKDKKPLTDARKLIESKMEEFKVCEKETKTKAYSKEGLAQVDRLDPAEQARQNTHGWIQECLSQLNEQIEVFEVDLDRLLTAKGKNKNKAEKENLDALLARHKWHILKLEQINRLLDNDALEPTEVDELKEDIEYYLESNMEPGFLDNYDDELYETLDLDTLGATMQVGLPGELDVGLDDAASSTSNDTVASAPVSTSSTSTARGAKTPKKSNVAPTVIAAIGRPGAVKPIELKSTPAVVSTPVRSNSVKSGLTASTPNGKTDDTSEKAAVEEKAKPRSTPTRAKPDASVAMSPREPVAAVAASKPASASSVASSSTASSPVVIHSPVPAPSPAAAAPVAAASAAVARRISPTHQRPVASPMSQTPTPSKSPAPPMSSLSTPSPQRPMMSSMSSLLSSSLTPSPPLVIDEPPPLTEEQRQILRMIDESFMFIPDARDSEKANRYAPRNPYPAPAAFPSTPTTLFDNATIFEKLDVDTLFFIFYYQQGSYQQYLAARELKRRTWGYHKKYKTWFKRHEEPQVTGDDYEQGTFVYFDYETGWCQRIKTEFTFEYSFLEDELQ